MIKTILLVAAFATATFLPAFAADNGLTIGANKRFVLAPLDSDARTVERLQLPPALNTDHLTTNSNEENT